MNKALLYAACAAVSLLSLSGCVQCGTGPTSNSCEETAVAAPVAPEPFKISSSDFAEASTIPRALACVRQGGQNLSPQLTWANLPSTAVSLAIIMDDETPPCGTGDAACVHWGVFNLPSTSAPSMNQGMDLSTIAGLAHGTTYNFGMGYDGPCPPSTHTYKITIFALSATMPPLATPVSRMTRSRFESLYGAYVLGKATLTGVFTP